MRPTKASLGDAAYAALKRDIVTTRLKPGARFSAVSTAERLGFGRSPIRQAVARLEREGLVEALGRAGHRVTPVTLAATRHVFHLRLLLEPEAAALAAELLRDPTRLRELDRLCHASYDPSDARTISAFLEANTAFHVGIAEVGNPRLARILEALLPDQERIFHVLLAFAPIDDLIAHEHKDLLDAITANDAALAREVTVAQLRAAQARTEQALIDSRVLADFNFGGAGGGPVA